MTQLPADRSARRSRRVQRAGAPGADPSPRLAEREAEPDSDHTPSWAANDERLRREVPPHY